LPTLENFKRRVFWLVARSGLLLYRSFPLFGSLRASIAVIRRGQEILVIERNDGRGVSLPGGFAKWKEAEEDALLREVVEETGLRVIELELRMRYHSTDDLPCEISVFEARAEGELKESWEGSPRWMTLAQIGPRILKSQRRVVEWLSKPGENAERNPSCE
jgi:ADP-ribose pyrophosphatase YjhB (NUDIX family)